MAEHEDDTLMKKLEEKAQFGFDDSVFKVKDAPTDEQESTAVKEDSSESEFEKEMRELGLSKDGLLAIIDDIVSKGVYEEEVSLLGGRIKCKFKSTKIGDSKTFVKTFDPHQLATELETELHFNLGSVAMVLIEHNGVSTGDTLQQRVKFIEENIAGPIFKIILKEVFIFGRKMHLIGSDEVADFF